MSMEPMTLLAREIVAMYRTTYSGAEQRVMTWTQTQECIRLSATTLQQKNSIGEPHLVKRYLDATPLAEEFVNRENTIRRAEIHASQIESLPPLLFTSSESHDWLDVNQSWPERGYWLRYKNWLLADRPTQVVDDLERDAQMILGRLGNPLIIEPWDRRGLVVGQVQSGKTQNFVGLLAMAIDAGYRQIVVLSGIHEDLRAQTQLRVDKGLIGQTNFDEEDGKGFQFEYVGVMEHDRSNIAEPLCLPMTSGSKRHGDFSPVMASRVTGSATGPYIYVVKKTKARLERLNNFFALQPDLARQPIIVVDDEADQASINNRQEDDPTTINRLIRELLDKFTRSSYVGYTATPFANIFGDPEHQTETAGADLFPKDFIVRLSSAPGYFGPAKLFGNESTVYGDQLGSSLAEVLIQPVTDVDQWMPPAKEKTVWKMCTPLPGSLREAIADFLVGAAIKTFRVEKNPSITAHTTMLINVPRINTHQEVLRDEVKKVCDQIEIDVIGDKVTPGSWTSLLAEAYKARLELFLLHEYGAPPPWSALLQKVSELVSTKLEVKIVNGTAKDLLDYESNAKEGLLVIAIGGDKLSRGMTLEGLTVSYFLRMSSTWDTLLQMGRWFGYKSGYLDLCRLRTSPALKGRFEEVTERIRELNRDLEDLYGQGAEPSAIGMFIQKSDLNLLPTRRSAFKLAKSLSITGRHSGKRVASKYIPVSESACAETLKAARWLYSEAKRVSAEAPADLVVPPNLNTTFFGVPAVIVADYVSRSALPPVPGRQSNKELASYIQHLAQNGMVQEWTVSFPSRAEYAQHGAVILAQDVAVYPALRSVVGPELNGFKRYRGSDISQGSDSWIDVSHRETPPGDLSELMKSRANAEALRPSTRGLLLCYPVVSGRGSEPGAVMYLSFPVMPNEKTYEVYANPVAYRKYIESMEAT